TRNDSVFVSGPYAAVAPEKGRAGTLLAAKTQAAGEQSLDKIFKAHRNFIKAPPQASANTIDHAAAHYGLADGDVLTPIGPVREQITDAHGKVMIRGQQPA